MQHNRKLVDFYHAARTTEERAAVQGAWMNGSTRILAATVAFGMGIDKPDVRWVFHHSMSKSLEGATLQFPDCASVGCLKSYNPRCLRYALAASAGYHQESGRAGRDGETSDIVLYFTRGDVNKARSLLESAAEEVGQAGPQQKAKATVQLKHNMESLNAVAAYAENLSQCRRVLLMRHFGENFEAAKCAGVCLKELPLPFLEFFICFWLRELPSANCNSTRVAKLFDCVQVAAMCAKTEGVGNATSLI